jgi:hypothetical protein
MNENGGLAVYMLYQSLRLHFISNSYDYFKYNGKTNTSKESFLTNKNKYSFYKLSRKYSLEECRSFFVANFLVSDSKWVGELLTEEAEEIYRTWQKRNQSLSYLFENQVSYLLDNYNPEELIKPRQGTFPILLSELASGKICIETMIILNDIMNFVPMWKKKIDDDIIWPTWQKKIEKYAPFIVYDKPKFKTKLKELYANLAYTT